MASANVLTKLIIDFVNQNNGFAFRVNSTGIYDWKTKRYRASHSKGISDIIICYQGQIICIEIKMSKYEVQLPSQIEFEKKIKDAGGIYKIVRNWKEFEIFWNETNKLDLTKI